MKKIEAVIPPSRLDAVRLELERRGIWGKLTLTEVRQWDTNPPSIRTEGESAGPFQHRIKVELLVSDRQADKIINFIVRYAPTDSSEDHGHVTLLDVCQVLQIAQPWQN
jgi:nitrogen regulatory protein PII